MKRQYKTTSGTLAIQRIPWLDGIAPEGLKAVVPERAATEAGLIDQWGRFHALCATSVVGRDPGEAGLAIIESSVSRNHAKLTCREDGWWLEDLGSTNGTYLDGHRIDGEVPLIDRQLLIFGDVGTIFVSDRESIDVSEARLALDHTSASAPPPSPLRLIEPSTGSGGIAEYANKQVQLGETQFALLQLLADRWLSEQTHDAELRGYVRSIDILVRLPWNTPHPNENNVKQVVRRTRRALESIGLGEAIESRQGFGYRLLLPPTLVA